MTLEGINGQFLVYDHQDNLVSGILKYSAAEKLCDELESKRAGEGFHYCITPLQEAMQNGLEIPS